MRRTARRNKTLHPPLSQRSARSLFHSFLSTLFCLSAHKVIGKHTTIFFVVVRWRVIMWSLSSLREQVGAQTGFHWGSLKNTHTHTHICINTYTLTVSVWEKNASKRGTAVWVAREDGDQVKGMMAYCRLHLCIQPRLRLGGGGRSAWECMIFSCPLLGLCISVWGLSKH